MKGSNKIYAVIDTNVLVSSLFSSKGDSNPAIVIRNVLLKKLVPIFNDKILEEYQEVLTRARFPFKLESIETLISAFKNNGLYVDGTPVDNENFPDIKDIVFYEVKMSVEDSYLVTGNIKHFPKKPFVVTPARMVSRSGRISAGGLQPGA